MDKAAFLAGLRERLAGLPQTDMQNSLDYYAEMIDERIEDGMPEEDAVRDVGSPDEIASQILSEIPLPRLVREKVRRRRAPQAWEIVLLVLGAPLWLPLLLAFLAAALSVYAVIWSVVATLYAADLSLAAGAVLAAAQCVFALRQASYLPAAVLVGAALCFAGLTVFLFLGSNAAAGGVLRLSRTLILGIKSRFVRKGAA